MSTHKVGEHFKKCVWTKIEQKDVVLPALHKNVSPQNKSKVVFTKLQNGDN